MRTMLDALVPAVAGLGAGVQAAAAAAEIRGKSTESMGAAGAGRSSYPNSETLVEHADLRATAIALTFKALATSL
jgi:dihydroxyacetone kinase